MDKTSATKLASEYYEIGVKLAHMKLSNPVNKAFHNTINAIIGGSMGVNASSLASPHARELIGKIKPVGDIFAKGDASRSIEQAEKLLANLRGGGINIGFGEGTNDIAKLVEEIAKNKAIVGDGLSTMEQVVDKLPGLGIAAGVGTGIYKGLGKLDKKVLGY